MIAEKRLKEMGIELPALSAPKALYVPVVQTGNLCYVSGQIPMLDGELLYSGKVGEERTLEEGQEAARRRDTTPAPLLASTSFPWTRRWRLRPSSKQNDTINRTNRRDYDDVEKAYLPGNPCRGNGFEPAHGLRHL